MNRILTVGVAAMSLLAVSQAQAVSLAEARAEVAQAAEQPAKLAELMKGLSAEEQAAFLMSVNEAIEKMPVSAEKKAALAVDANKEALRATPKANLAAMLAEVFATASLQSLTMINEVFAQELFARDADPTKPVSDEQMKATAEQTMEVIKARMKDANVSNPDERNTFAALMFLRASKGQPADLRDTLLSGLDKAAAETWVPEALGEQGPKSYLAMLGDSLEDAPDAAGVIRLLAAPHVLAGSMIYDLGSTVNKGQARAPFAAALLDPVQYALPEDAMDFATHRTARTLNRDNKWYNGDNRHEITKGEGHHEPTPYDFQ